MKKIFFDLFDFVFPRRSNDEAIYATSPADFYEKIPRWSDSDIYPDIQAIFRYKDPTAKAMIKELKSSNSRHAAEIAAYALAEHFEDKNVHGAVIIPMPISKKRRKKRGYNQCELIAELFIREAESRGTQCHFAIRTDIIEKTIDTKKSALQGRAARLEMNESVFKSNRAVSHIRERVIVIDDVVTTGSTMRSAIKSLRNAGARDVLGIGITH